MTSTANWLQKIGNPQAPTMRLVCFPHSGSGPGIFSKWSKLFPEYVEIFAVHLPHRERRYLEPAVTGFSEVADAVIAELAGMPSLPTAFYGHSLGAILAFETVREFEMKGLRPLGFFAAGRRGPRKSDPQVDISKISDEKLLEGLAGIYGTFLDRTPGALDKFYVIPIRDDIELSQNYRYKVSHSLSCPITVFCGAMDAAVDVKDAGCWMDETSGAFRLRTFPGGHFFVHDHVSSVAAEIFHDLCAWTAQEEG